jgi:large subunit ribosomal protein L17
MRHRKKLNHLGRTSSHRKAMLANMASSLILHKRISTTLAKAKALRIYFEPLVTKSKIDSTHSRRMVFSYLKDKQAVAELFREVSPKVGDRPGGYTRILKTGNRLGDNADMCIIELVDFNENMLASAKETKPAAKRSRRGRGKKPDAEATVSEKQKPGEKKVKPGVGQDNAVEAKEEEKPSAEKSEPAVKEDSGNEEGVKDEPEGSGEKTEVPAEEEKDEVPAEEEKAEGQKEVAGEEEKNDDQDEEASGKEGGAPDEKKPE